MAWLYILQCADGSYYVGSTPVLERRLAQHQLGLGGTYTSGRLPVRLAFACEFSNIEEAFYRERQVKGWRRAKKEALIRGDFQLLRALSRTARHPSTGSGRRHSEDDEKATLRRAQGGD